MEETSQRTTARGDLLLLAGGTIAFAFLSARFEFSEQLLAWTRPHERYQVDELPGVVLFIACGLAWYAWRRVAEARTEIALRRMTERWLRDALTQNRSLALAAVRLQEQERRSLARELHDELGQYLNAAKIDAVGLRDAGLARESGVAAGAIVASLDHMEDVVRHIVRRLRPPGLDELGLPAALEDCIEGWRRRLPSVKFRLDLDGRVEGLDEATNITLYRLVQEGLTNIAKHAQAALVEITLTRSFDTVPEVVLTLRDDGVGCVPGASVRGLGLIGMRERVEALAGRFEIAPLERSGFAFVARLPIATVAAA